MLPDALRERGARGRRARPLRDRGRAARGRRRSPRSRAPTTSRSPPPRPSATCSRRRAPTRSTARGSPRSGPPPAPSCAPTASSPTSRPTPTRPTAWWTRCWPTREARHMPRPITFLSDYGLDDEFVGVVHAVIAHECPTARVIDLSHGVPRQSVLAGALMLARALPYAPPGVHLAVVDPEVGARRRAVALRTARRRPPARRPRQRPAAARRGALRRGRRGGRDLDLAVAARAGLRHVPRPRPVRPRRRPARRAASRWPTPARRSTPTSSSRLELPAAAQGREEGALVAHAMVVDGFGNVQLDARPADLEAAAARARGGGRRRPDRARYLRTFADAEPGELLLYEDAAGMLALAVNGGEAAAELGGLAPGDEVRLAPVVTALGRPRLHHPRDRLDQPPRARARLRGRAARHARHRRRADRRARAPGPALGGARRLRAAVLARAARVRRAAVAPRRPRGGRRGGRRGAREVAQRRAGRRPQGRRRARRGPPARGLGGGRDRRQRRRAAPPDLPRRAGRWAASDVEAVLAELLGALEPRLAEPPEAALDALRARDALLGLRLALGRRRGRRRGDRRRRRAAGDDRRRASGCSPPARSTWAADGHECRLEVA